MTNWRVEFQPPRNRWIDATFASGSTVLTVPVSRVPSDSMADLASAVALVLKGNSAAEVALHSEPTVHRLAFDAAGDSARLTFARHDIDTGDPPLLMIWGTRLDVCVPLWRALRRLETHPPAAYEAAWGDPFPTAMVRELTDLITRRRLLAGP